MKSHILLFGLIIVFTVALLTRFIALTRFPVSLTIDEVEIGYNAYSLLKTGKDTWGVSLPLVFKSVGDYKPPVNFYLTVPAVAVLGLSEFAARLPAALLGTLTPVVLVILLLQLKFSRGSSLFTGIWLAILPWHLIFSRSGFEAVTALFFVLLGLCLYLRGLDQKRIWLITLSLVFFSLSVWAYHSSRLFVPLLGIFLLVTTFRRLAFTLARPRVLLLTALIFTGLSGPFVYLTFFSPAITQRAASTSFVNDFRLTAFLHRGEYTYPQERFFDADLYLIFHHWWGKYIDYFDLRFWFWKGLSLTPPGYPDQGLFLAVDLPLLFLGLYAVTHRSRLTRSLTWFWFIAGPLAASLTMNDQHPLRALIWLPAFAFIISAGVDLLRRHSSQLSQVLSAGYIIGIFACSIYFWDIYTVQYPRYFSEFNHYGFKQIAQYACGAGDKYDHVIISEVFGSAGPILSGLPKSFVLFYCRVDPGEFQHSHQVPRFSFRRIDWPRDSQTPRQLLIGSPWDFPEGFSSSSQILHQVNFLNGSPAFFFVATSQPS